MHKSRDIEGGLLDEGTLFNRHPFLQGDLLLSLLEKIGGTSVEKIVYLKICEIFFVGNFEFFETINC